MTSQRYYNDRYGQRNDSMYRSAPRYNDSRSRDCEASSDSQSSDYIAQPKYSSTDYISSSPQSTYRSGSAKRTHGAHSSNSDYIAAPVESRSDYISSCSSDSDPYSSRQANYADRDNEYSSRESSPVYNITVQDTYSRSSDYTSHRPSDSASYSRCQTSYDDPDVRYPLREFSPVYNDKVRDTYSRSTSEYSAPIREKSNYQLIKEGGWKNKKDFMRSHGLKTWEPEDIEEANEILNKYREIDAQNAHRSESEYYRQAYHGRNSAHDPRTYPSDSRYENDDMYVEEGSDICSYRSASNSGPGSPASAATYPDVPPTRPLSRGSDYNEEGYTSYDEDIASGGIQSGSDYVSCDGHGIHDGSDFASSDADQETLVSDGSSGIASARGSDIEDCVDGGYRDDCIADDYADDCIADGRHAYVEDGEEESDTS